MQKITSKENEFIKHIKKLKDKKYRDQSNEYIIEGIKLIQEAIQEKAQRLRKIRNNKPRIKIRNSKTRMCICTTKHI